MLMDALERELSGQDIHEYRLAVIAQNAEAIRYYQSRGMTLTSHLMLGRTQT
jgi:ribosomal protein S18 acetylase RimI-like enzyme